MSTNLSPTSKPVLSYTVAELSRAAGISEQTIRNALNAGQLGGRYVGRKAVIPVRSAEAWIEGLPSAPGGPR